MNEFRFADPERVHVIWAVLVLTAVLVALELRSSGALDRFISRVLQGRLVARTSRVRRIARAACLGLTMLFLVLALMRPQFGLTFVSTPRVGAEILVCIDVSRSMLAEDVVPNRLERAKAEVRDLLPYLEGDQVGLIAFAGRASIRCPLTPDFSFFRLVLDGVSANSVGRGGTRLEDPIRKAIDAFGGAGDAARAILLVSDGEDHDSLPIEACEFAKERGIQIIAIGFGDEGGSPIMITDPGTGAREQLRDREGEIVRSRLDGETLREMALVTEGVYVPAGTRSLDLEEIYESAIAPLTRGEIESGGRTVRQEAYQWPALAALLSLLVGATVTGRPRGRFASAGALALLAVALVGPASLPHGPIAHAQAPGDPADPDGETELPPRERTTPSGDDEVELVIVPVEETDPDAGLTPREVHNRALLDLGSGDLAAARRRFEDAERESKLDVSLRYRARYHLGWVEVKAALARGNDAEGALEAYRAAADHFRDAIRVQPNAEEARENLEVVLLRIRRIEDALRESSKQGLADRLDALIGRQRDLLAEARSLIERDVADPAAALEEPRRREYRAVAATERQILSDVEALGREAQAERGSIEAVPEEERTPEQGLRSAQLTLLLEHMTRSQERLAQARRTLRRQQGERAARRASTGLSALKRAREQLRDPLQVLDGLLPDARAVATYGAVLLHTESSPPGSTNAVSVPPWVTTGSLAEESVEIEGRVGELAARFRGSASAEVEVDPGDPESAARARLLEQVRRALPHLETATASYSASAAAYDRDAVREGFEESARGLEGLLAARELFLDAKGLIELLWQDVNRVLGLLQGRDGAGGDVRRERIPALAELDARNGERIERLRAMIDREAEDLERGRERASTEPDAGPSTEELDALGVRMDLADTLLERVETAADGASEWFGTAETLEPAQVDLAAGVSSVEPILPPLGELRRLYFTIVEHLRDLARRQQELNDTTADAIALARGVPAQAERHLAPIRPDQTELERIARAIAPALREQGAPVAGAPGGAATPGSPDRGADETAAAFERAAELVDAASGEMSTVLERLFPVAPETVAYDEATAAQAAALEQLLEALRLIEPQEPQPSEDDPSGQQSTEESAGDPDREPRRAPVDPAQLLQAVRDREAKRRAEKQAEGVADPTVERDW